jgi:hypothetical protein
VIERKKQDWLGPVSRTALRGEILLKGLKMFVRFVTKEKNWCAEKKLKLN